MPNWCTNYVIFTGKAESLKKVEEFCQNMDFQKLKPMPEILTIERGCLSAIAEKLFNGEPLDEYERRHFEDLPVAGEKSAEKPYGEVSTDLSYLWETENKENCHLSQRPRSQGDLYELGRIRMDNKKKYGASDWYEWRSDNWGTKWPAIDVESENKGEVLEYSFDNPWCPPRGIMEMIVKYVRTLSDVDMKWKYYIEMYDYGIIEMIEEGIKITSSFSEYYGQMDPIYKGLKMCLCLDNSEYEKLPEDIHPEKGLKKNFSNKEEMISYIRNLHLKNKDFKERLIRYANEYDVKNEFVEYTGKDGINNTVPIEYNFQIETIVEFAAAKTKMNGEDENETPKSDNGVKSFEDLLNS